MKKFLEKIIKKGGKKLEKFFKESWELVSLRKSSKEIVTQYDKIVDQFLRQQIHQKFPSHSILSEEGGFFQGKSQYCWIIDSLDGTSNFANHNPFFTICIALLKGKEILMGAIFAPLLQEFYFAQKGKGAFLNGKKIQVSKVKDFKESYLVFCEGAEKNREKICQILKEIYPRVKDLRKIGSAGLETAWVAGGRVDGYFTTQIDLWDVAPGILLVQEAGGKISNFSGQKWKLKRENLVFSNGKIHQNLIKILSKF